MFKKIKYEDLNPKQKENYNFQKVSAILAEYGYCTLRLSDDWNGADFIAVHVSNKESLNIQLKGRLTLSKKYIGKNLWICFPDKGDWYLYQHDVLVEKLKEKNNFYQTESWKNGSYHWKNPTKEIMGLIDKYKI